MPTRLSATGRRRTGTIPLGQFPVAGSTGTWTLWREYWMPLLLWCALVQYFSSDTFSGDQTASWLTPLLSFLLPFAAPETIDLLHVVVRKLSHVAEFFVMGWLALRSLAIHSHESAAILRSVAFVAILGGIDEWHQAMTLTRGPSLVDVGYDCIGGGIGIGWTLTRLNRGA